MRTNDLRKTINSIIKDAVSDYNVQGVYYSLADENALFPHVIFTINDVDRSDLSRADYTIDVDVYCKERGNNNAVFLCEEITDRIENAFNSKNEPQDGILPTFYLISRQPLADEDKNIKHNLVRFVVQLYEKGN